MQSKFWAGDSSTSESEFSEPGSDAQQYELPQGVQTARWIAADSSSAEDEVRVVRTLKDRRWDAIKEAIRTLENHLKIEDYIELYKDYDALNKCVAKASTVIENIGPPHCLIRALASLEELLDSKATDKDAMKKWSKAKVTAFNSLRAKLKKTHEDNRAAIDQCRQDPSKFESVAESSEKSDDDDGASSSGDDSHGGPDDEKRHSKNKKRLDKYETEWNEKGLVMDQLHALRAEGALSADAVAKAVTLAVERRGHRSIDKVECTKTLKQLLEFGVEVGPASELEILGHLLRWECDATVGLATKLSTTAWWDTLKHLERFLNLLVTDRQLIFAPHARGDSNVEPSIAEKQQHTAGVLTTHMERLDEELTKGLQSTDIHTEEYKERLTQTAESMRLKWRVLCFLRTVNNDPGIASTSLHLLEQIYFRNTTLSEALWQYVIRKLSESEKVDILAPDFDAREREQQSKMHFEACSPSFSPETHVSSLRFQRLVDSVLQWGTHIQQVTATLYLSFHKSLNEDFDSGKFFLVAPNLLDMVQQADIPTQVLYNRCLAQLGICAWKRGQIWEAHACFVDLCAQNKLKELVAQGLSNLKPQDKTAEQQRAEKRRLLPYHLHMPLDLIETIHNTCAMLLEVPYMAQNPNEHRKRPISKHFRRMLDNFDRQLCSGIPENSRDVTLLATKALQQGDWKTCAERVFSLSVWEHLPNKESVRELITARIKQEAMRTYLFTNQVHYDSLGVVPLAEMFDLPVGKVHSVVSKMMINEELEASWDESSTCILVAKGHQSRLQTQALDLASSISSAVEMNEVTLNMKNPRFALTERKMHPRDDNRGNMNKDKDHDQRGQQHRGYRGPDQRSYGYGGAPSNSFGFNPLLAKGREQFHKDKDMRKTGSRRWGYQQDSVYDRYAMGM